QRSSRQQRRRTHALDRCGLRASVTLIQAFFQYYWEAGEAAFAEIPAIWEAAKARIDAGEKRPSDEEAAAARRTSG
ncbi:hypothetical protein ACFQFS_13825, partial [Novosphingobium lubricantis]